MKDFIVKQKFYCIILHQHNHFCQIKYAYEDTNHEYNHFTDEINMGTFVNSGEIKCQYGKNKKSSKNHCLLAC